MKQLKLVLFGAILLLAGKNASAQCQAFFLPSAWSANTYDSVVFSDQSTFPTGSNIAYTWTIERQYVASTQDLHYTFTKPGIYYVCLEIMDSARNCFDQYCDSIMISGASSGCDFSIGNRSIDSCTTEFYISTDTSTQVDSIQWSFGDNTTGSSTSSSILHSYQTNGKFKVSALLFANGGTCRSHNTSTTDIVSCQKVCESVIEGMITLDSNYATSAVAYLIQKQGNNLILVDSMVADSGSYYYFSGVCEGDYLVKVALNRIDPNYADYIPTYYGHELRWDSVSVNGYVSGGRDYKRWNISLIKGNNPGGPGFIGGDVTKGANKKAGEAIANVEIILLNEAHEAVAYTYTDENGKYEFDNLALGSYYVFAEVTGLEINGSWIKLTEESKKEEEINIEINSDNTSTGINSNRHSTASTFLIYPNPAHDQITIDINQSEGNILIVDLSGRKVLTKNIANQATISVAHLEPGAYILMFTDYNGFVSHHSIVKK